MRYQLFLLTGFLFFIFACSGGKKISTATADPVSKYTGSPEYTVVYNLPRTSLQITVETTRIVTLRGPYYQFAEKYLGIAGVPNSDSDFWHISGVSIDAIEEADPDKFFVMVAQNIHSFAYLNLKKEGFILPVHHPLLSHQPARFQSKPEESKVIGFFDVGVNRAVTQETRSSIMTMMQDTAFVSVPVLRKEVIRKSLEEKAKEAADFILDLRMNRFKLISGEYDIFPDGKAIVEILNEYKRLENEYLSLFIGKSYKQKHAQVFEYVPRGMDEIERTVVFRFSDSKGILPDGDLSGRPIAMEISIEGKTKGLDRFLEAQPGTENHNRIYYRVPDVAFIQLIDGRSIIAKNRLPIAQFGKTLSVPSNYRWD